MHPHSAGPVEVLRGRGGRPAASASTAPVTVLGPEALALLSAIKAAATWVSKRFLN